MTVIPQRQLRNEIGDVLRRVEGGETFTVTVSGRPVAQVVPLSPRRGFATGEDFLRIMAGSPLTADEAAQWAAEIAEERQWNRENAPDPWAEPASAETMDGDPTVVPGR